MQQRFKLPLLTENDIECRIGTQKKDDKNRIIAASYLLYKDARCDMAILDKLFTPFGWKREHIIRENVINGIKTMVNYCKVSVWCKDLKEWVSKEDVGTESNTENAKGEASDSFKRACVNWGIGRELYTAPFIYIKAAEGEDLKYAGMCVKHIGYDVNRNINSLIIVDKNGTQRYSYGNPNTDYVDPQEAEARLEKAKKRLEEAIEKVNEAVSRNDAESFKSVVISYWKEYQKTQSFVDVVEDGKVKLGIVKSA